MGGTSTETSANFDEGSSTSADVSDDQGSGSGGPATACGGFADELVWPGDVDVETARDIEILAGIECIDGDLLISGPELVDLQGLEALVRVEGSVGVQGTEALGTTDGLASLTYVGGGLAFDRNAVLTQISLPSLSEVGVILQVGSTGTRGEPWGNASLVALDLPSFAVLHGDIQIYNNPLLSALDGLDALATVDGRSDLLLNEERVLGIIDNASLPMDDAYAFAARFRFDEVVICHNGGDERPCP